MSAYFNNFSGNGYLINQPSPITNISYAGTKE